MLTAVDLDDQSLLKTYEIGVRTTKRPLPSELETAQLPCTQRRPKLGFRLGRVPPQGSRPYGFG